MKSFILVLGLLVSVVGFAQTTNPIHVDITNSTDRGQLWQIHEQLKAQGLVFQYEPTFDNERRLTHIKYSVADNAGNMIVPSTETIGNIQKGTSVHFTLIKENNLWKKQ